MIIKKEKITEVIINILKIISSYQEKIRNIMND